MAPVELQWNAGYGTLPFDLYILEHWESTAIALPLDPQQTWNSLAGRYLRLPLLERWKYYKPALDAKASIPSATPLPSPTEEQINRIFTPHQTTQERNISATFCSGWNTAWLRTCYTPSLSQKYLELEQRMGARVEDCCPENPDHILDDASLYEFTGTDQEVLDQLLLRMPGLTDAKGITNNYGDESVLSYGSLKNDPEAIARAEADEEFEEIRKVELNVQNWVYVVDEEAVEKGIVKIWWFDESGKIIWDNIATPKSDLSGMLRAIMDGQGFAELVGEESKRGDMIVR